MRYHARTLAGLTACATTLAAFIAVGLHAQAPALRSYHFTQKDLGTPGEQKPNPPKVVPPPSDAALVVPDGFLVERYAEGGFTRPRVAEQAPNGDVFVVDTGASSIVVLRDANANHRIDEGERTVFATGLKQPYGLAFFKDHLYVANTDAVLRYAYTSGQTTASGPPTKIADLPSSKGGHWTRNIAVSPDGSSFYVTVGSSSNVDVEPDPLRATVLRFDIDGSNRRVVTSGVRNAVGLDFHPQTRELWMTVQERDGLGDELVPDYVARVKDGVSHGWPFAYIGQHEDPRHAGARPDVVKAAVAPEVLIQSHSSILGMAFYDHTAFPAKYRNGAFAALRGSSGRTTRTGYKLIFLPFENGQPTGGYEDFVVGWMLGEHRPEVWGRPVDVTVLQDGSLLIVEDGNHSLWRVRYGK
jgi:glucose/arabinose dehydrogenase